MDSDSESAVCEVALPTKSEWLLETDEEKFALPE